MRYTSPAVRLVRWPSRRPWIEQIDRRHKEHGDDDRDGESANEGASERRILFAAGFEAQRERNHAEEGGEGGHQDGAHTDLAGLHDCIEQAFALGVKDARELDDEDASSRRRCRSS